MPDVLGNSQTDGLDLLQRARKLDSSALSEIFDMYYDVLYRYINHHIGIPTVAEDLVSEVFRVFLEELKIQRGPTTNLKAWLYRVAHNLIVDEVRKSKHRTHSELDEDLPVPDDGISHQLEQLDVQEITRAALSKLTGKQKDVLILRYLHGLEIDEIAQILKMTTGTVKSLQHRALEAMRRQMKENGFEDELDL